MTSANLRLHDHEVHVWFASLDCSSADIAQLWTTLSDDERRRCARFHFVRDRNRFVVGRGLLRTLLSRYSRIEPSQVRFSYGQNGKPALVDSNEGAIGFNLSHSGGLIVYAVNGGPDVGIDMELVRPIADVWHLAERVLSGKEQAALHALQAEKRDEAFLRCWTRKEAYLKVSGDGLTDEALTQLDYGGAPDERPTLSEGTRVRLLDRWALVDLVAPTGYVAALVVEGAECAVRTRCFAQAGAPTCVSLLAPLSLERRLPSLALLCTRASEEVVPHGGFGEILGRRTAVGRARVESARHYPCSTQTEVRRS